METDETMVMQDVPVKSQNYVIVDNVTGKPIDQSTYTLTIDPEVAKNLKILKQLNEEKIQQAKLRDKYNNDSLVSTFTPTDNSVFNPVYTEEYIDYRDINRKNKEIKETTDNNAQNSYFGANDNDFKSAEVIQSDTVLDRVVARKANQQSTQQEAVEQKEELDYIHIDTDEQPESTSAPQQDNSVYRADNSSFQPQTNYKPINVNNSVDDDNTSTNTPKKKRNSGKINLDKAEINSGRKIAWLGYILFFLPLLFKPKNRFVRIHANEGLELNIMEIIGGALAVQYFIIKEQALTGIVSILSIVGGALGAGLIGACALTIIPMMICSLCGLQVQNPWLWRKRMIHIPNERIAE